MAENYIRISTIRTLDDKVFITQFYPDGDKTLTIYANGILEKYSYGAETKIENDIMQTKDLEFLSTIICSEGDDSIIFMIPSDIIAGNEEDNPCLLEVHV